MIKSNDSYFELTEVEKDIMIELGKKGVPQIKLMNFAYEIDMDESCKRKVLANDYGIKASWANIAYDIGKKLRWDSIVKGQHAVHMV